MAIILQLLCGEEDMVWNCFFSIRVDSRGHSMVIIL